jgi:hypothetical protein
MIHKLLETILVFVVIVIATQAIMGVLLPYVPWIALAAIAYFVVTHAMGRYRSW